MSEDVATMSSGGRTLGVSSHVDKQSSVGAGEAVAGGGGAAAGSGVAGGGCAGGSGSVV